MKRAPVVAALLLLLAACKKKRDEERSRAEQFRIQACSCKDVACVAKVNEEFALYAVKQRGEPSPEVTALYAQAAECMAMINAATPIAVAATSGDAPTIPRKPDDGDAVVRAVRDWRRAKHPRIVAREIVFSYIDATPALDPEHGAITVHHGAPEQPFDDPKRRTGAPVGPSPTKPDSCPSVYWNPKTKWNVVGEHCYEAPAYEVRCTAAQIWQRAIALGAPADALATLRFSHAIEPEWSFRITDEPRNVHVVHTFKDDCEPIVEKP